MNRTLLVIAAFSLCACGGDPKQRTANIESIVQRCPVGGTITYTYAIGRTGDSISASCQTVKSDHPDEFSKHIGQSAN
jgi:hypothetical protein